MSHVERHDRPVAMPARTGRPRLVTPSGPIRAAAGFAYESANKSGIPDFALTREQAEIDYYVGRVGWAGFFVLIKALLGAMCPWWVEVRQGRDWVVSPDPRVQALAGLIRPARHDQDAMRYRSLALQARLGEHAYWVAGSDRGTVFEIGHPRQLQRSTSSADRFVVKTRRDARQDGPGWHEYPLANLRRHWVPADDWPDEAKVPLAGALDEMRLYHRLVLSMLRTTGSRMLMNGLLWFETPEIDEASGDWVPEPDPDDANPGSPHGDDSIDEIVRTFGEQAKQAVEDQTGTDVASQFPFIFGHPTEPKMIELGRNLTAEDLEALTAVVLAGARGINIPTQFLVGGEASTNHWNDAELRRALHERAVFPELKWNNAFWTDMGLRPLLAASQVGGRLLRDDDPDDYRLACDTSVLEVRSDSLQHLMFAWNAGVARREWLADKIGVPRGDMLELPIDVSDYEAWIVAKQTGPRAQLEADRDTGQMSQQQVDAGDAAPPGLPVGDVGASAVSLIAGARGS